MPTPVSSKLRVLASVFGLALLFAACSGSSDVDEESRDDDTTTAEFCRSATVAMQGQRTASISDFSAQYFVDIDADLASLSDQAPQSLIAPLDVLRDGFSLTSGLYAEFGFDSENQEFLDALTERLDSGAMVDASETINAHLGLECEQVQAATTGTESPGGFSFDRSDPVGGVANIMAAFGTDDATAQCIYDAWGDVSLAAAEDLTPELWNFEICGTSIFQLITGDPRFTGRDQ